MKQAVILAAGTGSRLGRMAEGRPKCLQPIGGRTLLDLQLDILAGVGIEEVCVVVGYQHELIRRHLAKRPRCTTVENPIYAETNSLYSLWQARHWIRGSFLCLNGDVIAHPDIFHRVLAVEGNALAFDSASGDEDEHMKVATDGGVLQAISKGLPAARVRGENVGLLQFDTPGAFRLLGQVSEMIAAGEVNSWVPAALDRLGSSLPVRCVDIQGLPWVEVDFPQDLELARNRIWPAIAALVPDPVAARPARAMGPPLQAPAFLQVPHAI
ncbi:MAG: phosphocholine cytidylyltransferase family protein [Planctomycetota bacterium]|nr:MAG: phosphocholine cytidylyltransferase family protein [Planctomycetota bacterium]